MTTRKKLIVGLVVVAVGAAVVYANFRFRRAEGKEVTVEAVRHRNLVAVVSASGKIDPKRSVNISADVMGRVTELAVKEGEIVRQGQLLLQIDPRNLESALQRGQAGLAAAQSQLEQMRASVVTARENLTLARQTLQRQQDLWSQQLTTRENLDKAQTEVKVREADLREREQQLATQDQRIRQERADLANARYNLSKVRIESPIDGIVTRRNIEQGEMVVIGTMNNPGTVMLTIADMSVIEAEVEVDETDIPSIAIGQPAKVTIDAMPDKSFPGKVTEIGNSPIQTSTTTQASAGQQATNFKVVVTLDEQVPGVRPGFTCTAEITTDTRSRALSVPIQAMAVRELIYDKAGKIVPQSRNDKRRGSGGVQTVAAAEPLPEGQTRKETEGVFVLRNGVAEFVPVRTGIAGDKYFEVLSGLKEGDTVITGPFASVRDLNDGDKAKVEQPKTRR